MKKFIKKIFNNFGFEVRRFYPNLDFREQTIKAIKKNKIDVLFDIGANTGQFGLEIRSAGYSDKIVSFEPLSSAREKLLKLASKDANWIVHERVAIGNFNGIIDINVSKNSVSSSILPILKLHTDNEKNSTYINSEKTQIITLDSAAENYLNKFSNCFIKIDTQGYEGLVLDGAYKTLKKTKGILCELSLVPLYQGQNLWIDIISRLEKEGFALWSFENVFSENNNGRTLQIDGLFLKKDH